MDKSSSPKIETEESTIEISLPAGAKLNGKEGDKLKEDEILARVVQKGEIKEYDLAKILKVNPKKVRKCLLCSLGSQVKKKQIIAEKKSFFGSLSFQAPLSGTIEALTEKGVLKIGRPGEKIDFPMPVSGKIEKISSKLVVIKFPAVVLKAAKGFGEEAWGLLKLVGKHEKKVELSDLNRGEKGKVLVIAGKVPQALSHKAEALSAIGLVAGQVDEEEIDELIGLVVGDKEGMMSKNIWQELSQHEEKKVFISGERKELIIPLVK